ncbi:hypothetical protein G7070_10730 [Propioniciclava coleopterorum]|uniref:Secreted protein n=1 Tax=Propioniciclava coleopterorum TaxID=2714937 RepID=A0A6G7Y7R7_9ACTN|nr:hypothetical protein [Propioniciclava coleopterorum]QIK72657.1 hypothetical protein G7070_10730 [Propioniciclava coleopterorum]
MARRRFRGLVAVGALMVLVAGCAASVPLAADVDPPGVVSEAAPTASTGARGTQGSVAIGGPGLGAVSIEVEAAVSRFASPTHRILCEVARDRAACTLPLGMNRIGVPSPERVCPGGVGTVSRVEISPTGMTFRCGTVFGPWAEPATSSTRWADGLDVGLTGGMVTLPDGWTLAAPRVYCSSADAGVTCIHIPTGEGFRVAPAGVTRVHV